jgi:hypothetical protein
MLARVARFARKSCIRDAAPNSGYRASCRDSALEGKARRQNRRRLKAGNGIYLPVPVKIATLRINV